jgi:mRNA-degrading endonuclease RelE of RelBE toxin-antitoxin system
VPYTSRAVSRYNKQRRRLAKGVAAQLDAVQAAILQDPHRGERKKEQLRDVWVEKFKADKDQWLVAYEIDPKAQTVTFLSIGQHENFYRDLTRYRALRKGGTKQLHPRVKR